MRLFFYMTRKIGRERISRCERGGLTPHHPLLQEEELAKDFPALLLVILVTRYLGVAVMIVYYRL